MGKVYIVGTCDTKGAELNYAREVVLSAGTEAILVDVGTLGEGADAIFQRATSRHFIRMVLRPCSGRPTGEPRFRPWPRR